MLGKGNNPRKNHCRGPNPEQSATLDEDEKGTPLNRLVGASRFCEPLTPVRNMSLLILPWAHTIFKIKRNSPDTTAHGLQDECRPLIFQPLPLTRGYNRDLDIKALSSVHGSLGWR